MRFSPGQGDLACDHCGYHEPLTTQRKTPAPIPEIAFRAGIEASLPEAETETRHLSRCPNCGAEIEFDPAVHATECPFCATPVVADTGPSRRIKPAAVAPFVVTEPLAHLALTKWLGSRWFAPSGLMGFASGGRAMTGIYLPFWTFDAKTASRYSGRRGTVYYVAQAVQVRDQNGNIRTEMRQIPQISWAPAAGQVRRFFDDVLVLASKSLPQAYAEALMPWDLTQLEPYKPEFLAGFRSETYTVSLDEGMADARSYMDRMIERDVRFDIGGDRQEIATIETEVSEPTFKHVLLPVWAAAYRFRGKSYRFVVNGQTGKVEGERPWSWVKIAFAVLLFCAVAGGVGYFIQTQQMQGRLP